MWEGTLFVSLWSSPPASLTTVVPAQWLCLWGKEQVWVMGPPAVAGCKVGPSQCHSQATPLEVCVCAVRVSSPSPGCTWLWPQKCLQPQNCQLWEELSPGQELLGAGDSAAMLSKGCCARCRSTARSSSSASQSQQQLRSVHSSPGLWPGSPPHPRQHVVKLQPQPVAPRRNLCGFRSHKCQRGICWPWGLLTPLTKGAAAPGLSTVTWLRPALPQVTGQHILTPGPVIGSVVSPVSSPLSLQGFTGLGLATVVWGALVPPGSLCHALALLCCGVQPCSGGERACWCSNQAVVGWKDLQSGWGPPKNAARLLPPSLFTVSAPL